MTSRNERLIRIRQCTLPFCHEWYVGGWWDMYCPAHKGARIRNLKGRTGGKTSKFTPTMLEELRDMYLKYPVGEIAEHFGIARGSVYRLNKYTPKNLRDE